MDVLALILAGLAVVVGFLSPLPSGPAPTQRHRFFTVGVAVALVAAALICQFVDLTGTHVIVHHH